MKVMRPVETITTDNLLTSLESSFPFAFCLGLLGGMALVLLAVCNKTNHSGNGAIIAVASITLLMFLFFGDRYFRKIIIPEIRKRCQCDKQM